MEVAVNNQNDPPTVLKQFNPQSAHWLIVKLEGTRSNHSALGAQVKIIAGGHAQMDEVRSGGSYLSQNDLRLHFGLGAAREADQIEIVWPSGKKQILAHVHADQVIAIKEP